MCKSEGTALSGVQGTTKAKLNKKTQFYCLPSKADMFFKKGSVVLWHCWSSAFNFREIFPRKLRNWRFPWIFPWKTEHRMEWSLWTQALKEEEFFNSMSVSGIDLFFYFCWLPLLYSEKNLFFFFCFGEGPPFLFSFKKTRSYNTFLWSVISSGKGFMETGWVLLECSIWGSSPRRK